MSPNRGIALILTVISIIPPSSMGGSDEQRALLEWARSRFEAAGLTYPTVRMVFHDGLWDCDLRIGQYYASTSTVHLCRHEKRDVLHELSHAWTDQNMDSDQRHRFQMLRRLETWGSHELEWSERAIEHAAETLTWALMDRNLLVRWVSSEPGTDRLLSIPNSSHEELVDAFEMLTGLTPHERIGDRPGVSTNDSFSPELARMPQN